MRKGTGFVTSTQQDGSFLRLLRDCLEGIETEQREDLSIDATRVVEWVSENLDPEDVFSGEQLAAWALENNFEQV